MRIRMSGGVGRVIREDGPYPISSKPLTRRGMAEMIAFAGGNLYDGFGCHVRQRM